MAARSQSLIVHSNGWKEDYFQSAAIGQEFVMDAPPAVMEWLKAIFNMKN